MLCLFVCLFVWLVGWLVGWLTGWLVGWLVGIKKENIHWIDQSGIISLWYISWVFFQSKSSKYILKKKSNTVKPV